LLIDDKPANKDARFGSGLLWQGRLLLRFVHLAPRIRGYLASMNHGIRGSKRRRHGIRHLRRRTQRRESDLDTIHGHHPRLPSLVIPDLKNYNHQMTSGTIEKLLEAANSSPETDTSINLAKRQFVESAAAAAFFRETRERILRIDEWKKNSSVTDYDLFDESGARINHEPIAVGRFIRIALYGSGKYDWVRIVSITDEPQEFVITVQPTFDPTAAQRDPSSISHFFSPEATNNFCLQMNDKVVAFYVIGLNEHQNTSFTDGLIESARNAAVANVGYYSGMQKAVWKEFCSSVLDGPAGGD
jgi:hypothetical protein